MATTAIELARRSDVNGSYCRAEDVDPDLRGLHRFTAYVGKDFGDGVEETEEIDADAPTYPIARLVVEAAIARDYEDGVVILRLVEREDGGWYL